MASHTRFAARVIVPSPLAPTSFQEPFLSSFALGSQLSALSSYLSALGSQFSALSSQLSVLSSQHSALSSQLAALGSWLSAVSSRLSALIRVVCVRLALSSKSCLSERCSSLNSIIPGHVAYACTAPHLLSDFGSQLVAHVCRPRYAEPFLASEALSAAQRSGCGVPLCCMHCCGALHCVHHEATALSDSATCHTARDLDVIAAVSS